MTEGLSRIAAIILAAGRSLRTDPVNKLLAEVGGRPVVAWSVDAARASRAEPVVVVVGHEAGRIRRAVEGGAQIIIENRDYQSGLSGSLRAGLGALPGGIDGALILLGDMPRVRAEHLDRLIDAFDRAGGASICVPVHGGQRGNPVLWASRHFTRLKALDGDIGGRVLLGALAGHVRHVEMDDDGVLADVDTPTALEQLARLTGAVSGSPR